MKIRKSFLMASLAIASISLSGCGEQQKQSVPDAVNVKVASFGTAGNVENRYSGTVEEDNATAASFAVMGTISAINVEVGEQVKRGQLIATLDATSLKSSHDAALSTLRQAEDAYDRMKQLHDNGSLPEIKWVEVESKLQQARSMEEIARKNLKDARLLAPASGMVSGKSVERGQNVIPGQQIVKISSVGVLKVSIPVPESDIAAIRRGQEMSISVDALGSQSLMGKVDEIGVVADPLSHTYNVKLKVMGDNGGLKPGMVAKVSATNGETSRAMTLPANIVQIDEHNRTFVWIASGGKATKRYIQTGEYTPNGVIVANGLTSTDKVIVEGQAKVCEGTKVHTMGNRNPNIE